MVQFGRVMAFAMRKDRVLVTTDTDFGAVVALTGAVVPNVLPLRRVGDSVAERVVAMLDVLPGCVRYELGGQQWWWSKKIATESLPPDRPGMTAGASRTGERRVVSSFAVVSSSRRPTPRSWSPARAGEDPVSTGGTR